MLSYPNCKINIGLNVLRKREDGFHDLETFFYPVNTLQDELEICRIEQGVELELLGVESLGRMEDNLCVKAFRLLQRDFPIDGVRFRLTKRIPVGAGLGGGSADAAFALKLLNDLFDLRLTIPQLLRYGASLGSDVSFFINNTPSYATGVGEVLENIPVDLSSYEIKIIKPDFSISTAEAYGLIHPSIPSVSLKELIVQPVSQWRHCIKNDFETVLFPKYPILAQIKQQFYDEGAVYASLSGSGSAIYGIFE